MTGHRRWKILVVVILIMVLISPSAINFAFRFVNQISEETGIDISAQGLGNPEWLQFYGSYLSVIATAMLGLAAIWQNDRISKVEQGISEKQKISDAKNKAIEQSYFFTREILPTINKLDRTVEKSKNKIDLGESRIEAKGKKYIFRISKNSKNDKSIRDNLVDTFNILETFSIITMSELVDFSVMKMSCRSAFCFSVERYLYFLGKFFFLGEMEFGPIIKLYIVWKFGDDSILDVPLNKILFVSDEIKMS